MEKNANQNELGVNSKEPITPRKEFHKDPKSDGSILDKVTGLFGHKESTQPTQFAVRKEPTFGHIATPAQPTLNPHPQPQNTASNAVVNYTSQGVYKTGNPLKNASQQNVPQVSEIAQPSETVQPVEAQPESAPQIIESVVTKTEEVVENVENNTSPDVDVSISQESAEKVVEESTPVAPVLPKNTAKNPENWAIMQKLPTKHRRLFIAIAGAVGVLLALLLLKPSNDNVQEIQTNTGNSMPIEFQSLDPNAPIAEPVSEESTANTEKDQKSADKNTAVSESLNNNAKLELEQPVQANVPVVPENGKNTDQGKTPVVEQAKATAEKNVAEKASDKAKTAEQAKITEEKAQRQAQQRAEQQRQEQQKAEQAKLAAEKARKAEQAQKAQQAQKMEQMKKAEQQKAEQARLAEQSRQAAEKAKAQATKSSSAKAPIVEASQSSSANNPSNASTGAMSSKTLTVPAGTSLFQVFRNNGLDIRDANAMTKASGIGNVLSSFKANDKVQVSVNSQGRVSTMRLSNGATLTRQSDGTYKYSK